LLSNKKKHPGAGTNGLGLDGPPCRANTLTNCSIVDTAAAVLNFGRPYSQTTIDGDQLPFPGSLSLPFNGPTLESLVQSAVTQVKTGGGSGFAGPTSVPPPVSCCSFFFVVRFCGFSTRVSLCARVCFSLHFSTEN